MQLLLEFGNVRSPLPDSSEHVWPDPAKLLDSGHFGQIRRDPGRMSPDSGIGNISVVGCCQIPVPPGFRRPTIARFQQ
jgi:hypothetical protein